MSARTPPRVLVLTAIYPPDERVGGLRPAKLVRHLRSDGFEVDVITAAHPEAGSGPGAAGESVYRVQPERTLRDRLHAKRAVTREPTAAAGGPSPEEGRRERSGALRTALRALLVVPDLERGLIRPMVRAARMRLATGPAIVYSTAPPHSVSVAARLAVRGHPVPWVAEFRDPWTDGGHAGVRGNDVVRNTLNRWLERAVLSRADRLVAVSDGIADWLGSRAPGTPTIVSRNGIDSIRSDRDPSRRDPSGPITALYLGELYLGRDPVPLLDAIVALPRPPEGTHLECRFVGDVETFAGQSTQHLVESRGLRDVVSLASRVPRSEALGLLHQADLLILLAQRQPLQVPNKLYEYLGTRKPILAFADHAGETARLLRMVGGHFIVTEHHTAEDVVGVVAAAVAAAAAGTPTGDLPTIRSLAAEPQMDRVAELLRSL